MVHERDEFPHDPAAHRAYRRINETVYRNLVPMLDDMLKTMEAYEGV